MSVSTKDHPMNALTEKEEELVEQLKQAVAPLVEVREPPPRCSSSGSKHF